MEEIIELIHAEIVSSGYHKKLAGGIVLTGGGAQLANLSQLVEYMTGLDARIGHPNEHLGKSKIESIKGPMYATAIGLVLTGFMAMDMREERYLESAGKPVRRDRQGNKFFKNILQKTKGLLIDDFDDNDYK